MFIKQPALILVASVLLTACSSTFLPSPKEENNNAFVSQGQASQTLAQRQACCSKFNQLQYQEIGSNKQISIALTGDSQVYNFPSGKSFVQAYKLTGKNNELKLQIDAIIANTVVAPQVTLLDGNFNITRTLTADKFTYAAAKLLDGDKLSADITIYRPQANNLANETYLLFYTTKQAMAGTTRIIHPAKSFAKAHGTVPPTIADPIIPHSAMGLIELSIETEKNAGDIIGDYIPSSLFSSNNKEKLSAATELQFNQAIENAVAENDINQALTIIDQAEAAGSQTARETFVNALNRTTKHTLSATEKAIIQAVAANNIAEALTLVEQAEAQGSTTARAIFIQALKKNKKDAE